MSKKARQYIGLLIAVVLYYVIHEGAHLVVALALGVFKQINIIGLGVQIDVMSEQMDIPTNGCLLFGRAAGDVACRLGYGVVC